ncbi:unnamed protein product [Arabidopsis halleri]
MIDSDVFRDLYESLNSSSSSVSWSIMSTRNKTLSLEIVGHHGCERWGLTDSLGSFITRHNPSEENLCLELHGWLGIKKNTIDV